MDSRLKRFISPACTVSLKWTDIVWTKYSRITYIRVKTLPPGGKTWLSQEYPGTPITRSCKWCSSLYWSAFDNVFLQEVLKAFYISKYLWHTTKISFPLLGSSIFYNKKNLIKVKLNIRRFTRQGFGRCPGAFQCHLIWNANNSVTLTRNTGSNNRSQSVYSPVYTLSIPSSSGVEIPSSSNAGLSSWITYG